MLELLKVRIYILIRTLNRIKLFILSGGILIATFPPRTHFLFIKDKRVGREQCGRVIEVNDCILMGSCKFAYGNVLFFDAVNHKVVQIRD